MEVNGGLCGLTATYPLYFQVGIKLECALEVS